MGGTLVNNGALEWTAAADFQQGGGSAFSNNGLFDISTDADFTHATGAPASFVNSGRLVKSAGSGETSLTRVDFSNPGTIDVRSGTIVLPASFDNAGLLTGTGTYSYSGFLDNEGHIAPGASPGTLTLDGHFRQSETGVLDIEVNSVRLHDLLIVDGTVQLGGTLALHCFADCFVGAGETITILMASGPLLSAFDTVTLKGFGGGSFVAPRYDGGQVSLLVTGALVPVPEPEVYAMMLTGLGLVAWSIRRRQRRLRRL
jgi:hypothetical protein